MGFPRGAGAGPRATEAATLAGAEPYGAPSLKDRSVGACACRRTAGSVWNCYRGIVIAAAGVGGARRPGLAPALRR
ncbi:hypothetical protein GCM10010402_37010 [Actinomadura luteofluorescens]